MASWRQWWSRLRQVQPPRPVCLMVSAPVGAVSVAVLVAAACLTPEPSGRGTHSQLGLPGCLVCRLLARPRCPSCGLTTGFAWMMRGQFRVAFQCHPFAPPFFVFTAATAILAGFSLLTGSFPWLRVLPLFLTVGLVYLVYWFGAFFSAPNPA